MKASHYHRQRGGRGRLNKSGHTRPDNAPSVSIAPWRVTNGERTVYCCSVFEARRTAHGIGGTIWNDKTGKRA